MYNKNAAYDLSLFDEKARKNNVVRLNVKKIRYLRRLKAKLALMLSGMLIFALVALGITVFISGQAKIAEQTEEITRLSRIMQENESLHTQLCMKKKSEISKDELAIKLENELGMVKNGNIEYINVLNCNKAEINDGRSLLTDIKNQVCEFCNNLWSI